MFYRINKIMTDIKEFMDKIRVTKNAYYVDCKKHFERSLMRQRRQSVQILSSFHQELESQLINKWTKF